MTLQGYVAQAHQDFEVAPDLEPLISVDHYPPPDLPEELQPWWVWVNEDDIGHCLFVLHPEYDSEAAAPDQWVEESLITVPVNTVRRQGWDIVEGFISIKDPTVLPEDPDRTGYFSRVRYECEVCQEPLPADEVHGPPYLQWHPGCKAADTTQLFSQERPPSLVIDPSGIFAGFQELRARRFQHFGEVAELVLKAGVHTIVEPKTSKRPAIVGEGQAWITKTQLTEWGIDVEEITAVRAKEQGDLLEERTWGTPLIADAVSHGWTFERLPRDDDGDHALKSAFTMSRALDSANCERVRIVLIPFIETPDEIASEQRGRDEAPLLKDDPSPAAIAHRLSLFTLATGFPWMGKGGTTGIELLKAVHAEGRYDPNDPCNTQERGARLIQHRRAVDPVEVSMESQTIDWHRELTAEESKCRWIHSFDRNAAYLALIGSQPMPLGRTRELVAPQFDKKMIGFWKIVVPERPYTALPHPLWAIGGHWNEEMVGEERWVTTPSLLQATKDPWTCEPQILEALIWEKSAPIFKDWQRHLSAPRRNSTQFLGHKTPSMDADARAVQNMAKSCYKIGIGMIGQKFRRHGRDVEEAKQSWVNRNWHHFIISRAREGMLITLGKIWETTNRAPVAVKNDSIYFLSDDPDPISAWPLRQPNGKPDKLHLYQSGWFKHEASAEVNDEIRDWLADSHAPGKLPMGEERP